MDNSPFLSLNISATHITKFIADNENIISEENEGDDIIETSANNFNLELNIGAFFSWKAVKGEQTIKINVNSTDMID